MILLPTSNDPFYTFSTVLEGDTYEFTIQYNPREITWYCFVGFVGSKPSCKFKLTNGTDLLKPYKHLVGVPQGGLYLIDSALGTGRPSRDDFGGDDKRFALAYFLVEELDEIL